MAAPFTFSAGSVIVLAQGISLQSLGDDEGGVVLRLDSGELYTVNDTALEFLSRLDGLRPISALAVELEALFEIDIETLTDDLVAITRTLADEGLVVPA